MLEIRHSVGRDGRNEDGDAIIVQELLNANLHRFVLPDPIREDGIVGIRTIDAIEKFQAAAGFSAPDGRVDPGGRTLRELNRDARPEPVAPAPPVKDAVPAQSLCFPFDHRPGQSYTAGSRAFGSNRKGGRRHAGCDLYGEIGTEVRAMADGVVIRGPYPFYLDTFAIEIDHGGFVARYGEIAADTFGVTEGVQVKRGQKIGTVGDLRGIEASMLHLEIYDGSQQGPLTDRENLPYKRRSDLVDPTPMLDDATP